jgi:exodeoxyribonuclease V alpha subunit
MPEIKGIIEEIVFRNEQNGFTVAEVREDNSGDLVTVVGALPFLGQAEKVRIVGEWKHHPDYGKQIAVISFESIEPETSDGLFKYLSSGLIKGVGQSTAKKLLDRFGDKVLDVLRFNPERLIEVDGIGPARAAMITASFTEQQEVRDVMIFLQTHGITPGFALKIYKVYGKETINAIKENPYRLADEVNGIGFKIADKLATSMGVGLNSPFRLSSGVKHVLFEAAGDGHTFLPLDMLIIRANGLLGADTRLIEQSIDSLLTDKSLFKAQMEDCEAIYVAPYFYAEAGVCQRLLKLSKSGFLWSSSEIENGIKRFQEEKGLILAEKQRHAVLESMTQGVAVITGGPGTGKTTIVKCIIDLFDKRGLRVELAAPTGRAAKRLSETTGKEARTIHRLLEYSFSDEGNFFKRDENEPINADAVIIDEVSMVDILLMYHLLKAIPQGTRLILVGDMDQLPSVGPGNVLRDIINSSAIKVVKLDEIFRQAQESMIVVNAHRINHGEFPQMNLKGKDFFFDKKDRHEDILEATIDLVLRRLPEFKGYDPCRSIQIMSPMRKGEVGVNNLNVRLQQALNPPSKDKPEKKFGDTIFRKGDRIMQIANNYRIEWKRISGAGIIEEGTGIFNGDMGYVKDIDDEAQALIAIFDGDKVVEYDFSQLDELELGYAISIHKSQGSEFPAVILPLAWGPPQLMTRNLLYTAVTRAREMVVIVGQEKSISKMIENNHITRRYSGLCERLGEYVED